MKVTDVIWTETLDPGWAPIATAVGLAAEILGGQLIIVPPASPSAARRVLSAVRPDRRNAQGSALFIANLPKDLLVFSSWPAFSSYDLRVAWIIDSFWSEMLPRDVELAKYDYICYSHAGDRKPYEQRFGKRAIFAPLGSDVLNLGSQKARRSIDLLRIGRQPDGLADDYRTNSLAREIGLSFAGRPPFLGDTLTEMHLHVCKSWYAESKVILASSNLWDASTYTHPNKDYVTSRWLDAVSCGAAVAGVQPSSVKDVFWWPEALIEFSEVDASSNLEDVLNFTKAWSPRIASINHLAALCYLDWRWSFLSLIEQTKLPETGLHLELSRLQRQICRTRSLISVPTDHAILQFLENFDPS